MINQKLPGTDIRIEKLLENSHFGLLLLDTAFTILYSSYSAQQINGWAEAGVPQSSILDIIHPRDRAIIEQALQSIQTPGTPQQSIGFRWQHANGHYLYIEGTFTNMLYEHGIEAIVCNFADVSAQKKIEQKFRKQSGQINELLNTMTDGFISLDENLCYTYLNKAVLKLMGSHEAKDLIGKYIWDVFPTMVGTETHGAIQQAFEQKEYVCNEDFYAPTQLWYENRVYPSSAGGVSMFIRDITRQKNEELQAALLADVSLIFNEPVELSLLLHKLLQRLADFGHFILAEIWLVGTDKNRVNLTANLSATENMKLFYEETAHVKSFVKAGDNHSLQKTVVLQSLENGMGLLRFEAAKKAGIQSALAVPLVADNANIGGLILALGDGQTINERLLPLFDTLGGLIGAEIKRKQLEHELNQLFNSAPDMICVLGTDYYLKKVNPAMCRLLEYTEEELLSERLHTFLHPDEWATSQKRLQSFAAKTQTLSFENRLVTKSGKTLWLSWTASNSAEEGLIFGVAKDITYKKELENLLDKVTSLARVGGWEYDVLHGGMYWSQITKEIHEVEPDFVPTLDAGLGFYKPGHDSETIILQMQNSIDKGTLIDTELQIITAKGNHRWVRVVGEPEFVDGKCVRLYGSFQDIDARVRAELSAKNLLEERNVILESIGDAFFAVDQNWVVTYWNNMAEKVLRTPKANILHQKLWEVFSGSTDSVSYRLYHRAMETGEAVHFEDHYPTLNKWYDISAYPSANGLSVYFKDITERKVTDELLKDSEKRYSELFQLSPLPNLVYDLDTLVILDVNEVAITHYGYSREEFLSMSIKDLSPAEEHSAIINEPESDSVTFPGPVKHRKKNGEVIFVEIKSNTINYQGRNACVVAANDITERLNYTKAVEAQNEKLKEISWIQSHIVRAPLSRIMGLIPLLNDPKENEETKKQILEYIRLSAFELDDVIKDITDKTTLVNIDKQ